MKNTNNILQKLVKFAIASTISTLAVMAFSFSAFAAPYTSDNFVITIQTTVANQDFLFPVKSSTGYSIDCDYDGSNVTYDATGQTTGKTCHYPSTGYHTLVFSNAVDETYYRSGENHLITSIDQWGTAQWTTLEYAFLGASKVAITATDTPDLSNTTSTTAMFSGASVLNQNINNWNVSNIEDFSYMFYDARAFNQPLNNWDTSSALKLNHMFANATSFNQDISNWNTSNVTTIKAMFWNALSFNQNIGNWDIGNVTTMMYLFSGTTLPTATYDAILTAWENKSHQNNVTLHGGMSRYCNSNTAHNTLTGSDGWIITDGGYNCEIVPASKNDFLITVKTTSNNEDVEIPAYSSSYYHIECENDNDSTTFDSLIESGLYTCTYPTAGNHQVVISNGVTNITYNNDHDEDKIISLDQWGTAIWSTMQQAYAGAINLEINATDKPDMSNMTNLGYAFGNIKQFNQNINDWDTSNIQDMSLTFANITTFNQDVSDWDTSNATTMASMFMNTSFNQDISNWDTSNVTNMQAMLASTTTSPFNQDISDWNISNVTAMDNMFTGATLDTSIYDNILTKWEDKTHKNSVTFDGGNSHYCSAAAVTARGNLTGSDSWTITDAGQSCPPPVITSNGGGDITTIEVPEYETDVTRVIATYGPSTFTITAGNDQALFSIDGTSGELTFNAGHTVASPADSNHDNIYEVSVTATTGSGSDTQAMEVTISNQIEEGRVMGVIHNENMNAGTTYYNAHPAPGAIPLERDGYYLDKYNQTVDLSIIGAADGLAPTNYGYATSADYDVKAGSIDDTTYKLNGYAWNDNLGFISYNCESGLNEGVSCGSIDYGVKISAADANGIRTLSGHAWNQAFGWIYFAPGGGYPAITRGADGFLSGYAWTEAGIWLNFNRTEIELPGDIVTASTTCLTTPPTPSAEPRACIEIEKSTGTNTPVADGHDNYKFKIYLIKTDGTPYNQTDLDNNIDVQIDLDWTHTLKTNQEAGQTAVANWATTEDHSDGAAGIVKKPVTITDADLTQNGDYFELNSDFNIKSYAPTSNANTAETISGANIENDSFFYDVKDPEVTPVENSSLIQSFAANGGDLEKNRLSIDSATFSIEDQGTLTDIGNGTTYINGNTNYNFKFKPAIDIHTLFADAGDEINVTRSKTTSFELQGIDKGSSVLGLKNYIKYATIFLTYAEAKSGENECVAGGTLTFQFTDGTTEKSYSILDLKDKIKLNGQLVYTEGENGEDATCTATGPTLFSKIEYTVDAANNAFGIPIDVKYYNNKLPKTKTVATNIGIMINGNLKAQAAVQVKTGNDIIVTGNLTTSEIRNTIRKNISTKLDTSTVSTGNEISSGTTNSGIVATIKHKDETTEDVFYFKQSTGIYINGVPSYIEADPNKTMTVINDGGPIFIKGDIYDSDAIQKHSLVSLRDSANKTCNTNKSGNIYITPNVKNIQASMAADCSIFSVKSESDIKSSGLPDWADYKEMVQTLSKQIIIEGNIFSRNTVGGAALDLINKKDYILLGTGEIFKIDDLNSEKTRFKAQLYDLNYLRLFKLGVQTDANGNIMDQSCQKFLTAEERTQILAGITIIGSNGQACDGIDENTPYDPNGILTGISSGGDQVVEVSEADKALNKGEIESTFDPSIIKYIKPSSFIFDKTSTLMVK